MGFLFHICVSTIYRVCEHLVIKPEGRVKLLFPHGTIFQQFFNHLLHMKKYQLCPLFTMFPANFWLPLEKPVKQSWEPKEYNAKRSGDIFFWLPLLDKT